jgi:hypothetical protein
LILAKHELYQQIIYMKITKVKEDY